MKSEIQGVFHPDSEGKIGVLFVIDAPSAGEVEKGKLSVRPLLRESLALNNIAFYGITVISSISFGRQYNAKTSSLGEHCRELLPEDLTAYHQRITVTLGAPALRFLNKDCGNITRDHGKRLNTDWNDIKLSLFPMIALASVFYGPTDRGVWDEDFRKLKELLAGGE